MPNETFVVYDPAKEQYLAEYDAQTNTASWGNLAHAMEFSTLVAAQSLAADIGGGKVGTTRPN